MVTHCFLPLRGGVLTGVGGQTWSPVFTLLSVADERHNIWSTSNTYEDDSSATDSDPPPEDVLAKVRISEMVRPHSDDAAPKCSSIRCMSEAGPCDRIYQTKSAYARHRDSRCRSLLLQDERHDLLHLLGREACHARRCRKSINGVIHTG